MHRVLAVCGSLRAESANLGLLRMALRLAPADVAFDVYEGLGDMPFYNPELDEPDRVPASVERWRRAVGASDGLLLAAPEYNYGPTGVMKNALDWASRPLGTHSIQGKAIAVVTSGGGSGGRRVQTFFNDILTLLGNTMVMEPVIAVERGSKVISPDGTTTEPDIEARMAERLANLAEALRSREA